MPIYEATASHLTAIPATSFAALGLKERADLQRLLAARIEALEDGLLVLAEEFGDWADSARRIDLLCLDTTAHLVVVELKRDDNG
jgi:RecB family endonuclease NucS